MFSEVMNFFGLEQELDHLGFFATEAQTHLEQEISKIITQGRLIALSGIVGSGKTTFLQRLIADLGKAKEILVSRSLAVESDRVSLSTLITALFYDLSTEKDFKVPTQPEKRERRLLELIKKCQRTVDEKQTSTYRFINRRCHFFSGRASIYTATNRAVFVSGF